MWLGPPYMNRKITLLALGGAVRLLRRPADWRTSSAPSAATRLAGEEVVAEQARQGDARETGAGLPEEFAPRAAAEVGAWSLQRPVAGDSRVRCERSGRQSADPDHGRASIQIHKLVQIQRQQAETGAGPRRLTPCLRLRTSSMNFTPRSISAARRLALQDAAQGETHLRRRLVARAVSLQSSAKIPACELQELAVEHPQGLRRLRRGEADRAGGIGIGRVERRQDRHGQRALDVDEDAPRGGLFGRRVAPAVAGPRLAGQHFGGNRRIDARALLSWPGSGCR